MKKIGLLGFGLIGQYVYEHLQGAVEVAFIYDRKAPEDAALHSIYIDSKEAVIEKCVNEVDLVVECATSDVLKELTADILRHTDLLAFSVTAFAEEKFQSVVNEACQLSGHTFYIPHGAILGLDGIFDGKAILESVTVVTTKKPGSLGLTNTEREVIYEGPTRAACKAFPRNVNVHAAIALAGLGFDKTMSQIVSDPESPGNTHHIEVKADGVIFGIDVTSVAGSGVTGAYTPISAVASIKRVLLKDSIKMV